MSTNSIFHDISPNNKRDAEKLIEAFENAYYNETNNQDPNDFQCDNCGNTLTSESCYCPNCNSWLCNGCAFEDECEERQG